MRRAGSINCTWIASSPGAWATCTRSSNCSRPGWKRKGCSRRSASVSLPEFPHRIGVVTSPTGAVIRDICNILARRWPLVEVLLAPTQVQGARCPAAHRRRARRAVSPRRPRPHHRRARRRLAGRFVGVQRRARGAQDRRLARAGGQWRGARDRFYHRRFRRRRARAHAFRRRRTDHARPRRTGSASLAALRVGVGVGALPDDLRARRVGASIADARAGASFAAGSACQLASAHGRLDLASDFIRLASFATAPRALDRSCGATWRRSTRWRFFNAAMPSSGAMGNSCGVLPKFRLAIGLSVRVSDGEFGVTANS